MKVGKVLARGQITLPREIRRDAEIRPGDTVSIEMIAPGRVEVKVLSRLTLDDLLERYPIEGPVDLRADRAKWEEATVGSPDDVIRGGDRE